MFERTLRNRWLRGSAAASALIMFAQAVPAHAQEQSYQFDIAAQDMGAALRAFARAARQQVTFDDAAVRGRRAPALRGSYSARVALDRLLDGSGLVAERGASGLFIVRPAVAAPGEGEAGSAAADSESADAGEGVAEILVVGSRSLNADIRRSEDDAQPYVIFSQEEIRRSNATNVDDFLRTRLPQNTQSQGVNQIETVAGVADLANAGRIDLRGLGTNQTLVLVDGRRVPGASFFNIQQANVSGIPLSAIERIEVLPSTAGAIYGGSAVGGVVNIVLRRNFTGVEARLDYGNTFDGTTGDFKASLLGGFGFGGTRIMFRASRERTADLLLSDRSDFFADARARRLANNPAGFAQPPASLVGNICASVATGNGSCNGAPLIFDNGTPLGASFTYIPDGYAGPASGGTAPLLANAGRYRFDAPEGRQALIQGVRTDALGLNVTQSVTNWLQLFADASWDQVRGAFRNNVNFSTLLQANAANNPFQQPILVSVPLPDVFGTGLTDVETWRLNGGAIVRLPWGWSASLEQGWSRVRTLLSSQIPLNTAAARALFAPFAMADVRQFPPADITSALGTQASFSGPIETTTVNTSLRLAGPLFALPGGRATATLLAERREDRIDRFVQGFPPTTFVINPSRRQQARSFYFETRLPVIAAANDVPLLRELELQASVRLDRYEAVGTISAFSVTDPNAAVPDAVYFTNRFESVDYLVGARLSPVEGIILRGSYSTGFLPPAIINLSPTVQTRSVAQVAPVADPRRGGEDLIGDLNGNVVQTIGGNPSLQPENSRSLSFGAVLQPRFAPGLRLSADYTDIRKSGEINSIGLQDLINNEASFPGRITRGPNRPGDPTGYAGPIIAYDTSLLNIANTRVKAWDFQVDYDLETPLGRFQPYAIATRQTAFARALLPGSPLVSRLDFVDGPLRWRGNVGLNWSLGSLSLGWNMQYYDSYRICTSSDTAAFCATTQLNQGSARIRSQSYHDISARYEFGEGSRLLTGTEIAVGIQNLFDQRPPLLGSATSFRGFYSGYGDPRLRRFTLSIRRQFGF